MPALSYAGLHRLASWIRFHNYIDYTATEILQIGPLSAGEPRGIALDIGAADGIFADHFRKLGYRVVAFEANPTVAARLRTAMPWVRLEETALSNAAGTADLVVPFNGSLEIYGLGSIEKGVNNFDPADAAKIEHYAVKTTRLDDYGLENVRWIKIDVEGHETAVLQGAMDVIRKSRPKMLIEMGGLDWEIDNQAILQQLRDLGYSFSYLADGKYIDVPDNRLTTTRDLFCIPSAGG